MKILNLTIKRLRNILSQRYFPQICNLEIIKNEVQFFKPQYFIIVHLKPMQDDSDNDEGFVANNITIAYVAPPIRKSRNTTRNIKPLDFQARYIHSQGLFRKEPYQSYQPIKACDLLVDTVKAARNRNKTFEEPKHPYEQYFSNMRYKLVFSRNKDSDISHEDENFCKNQIPLTSISSYDTTKYSLFKPFEHNSSSANSEEDVELEFDSRFESGNLMWAFRRNSSNSYVLFIQNDTNTYGYNQWFYFSVRNMKPGVVYSFHIVNFKKRHSFFRYGKKIAMFSMKQAEMGQNGWSYQGDNIVYERSPICSENMKYFSLAFDLTFNHENDYAMISMNFPYSYSKLIKNLKQIECQIHTGQENTISWIMQSIAHTLSSNAVPYLTITSTKSTEIDKKVIILMARQHPGQTWSSFLMEQFLKEITGGSQEASWLLDNFVFKIFPMVNVDGVIYGNFRCDLAGVDLNRNWKYPSKVLHPQIYAIREEIEFIAEKYLIVSCLDLHGHSKQYNTFCYSCKTDNISSRVLPYIFSRIYPGFHFPYCTFGISKFKESTARAVIFNAIKNPNVLTLECSFYGQKTQNQVRLYAPSVMNEIAKTLVQGLKSYYSKDEAQLTAEKSVSIQLKQMIEEELQNQDQAGSESDPSGDQIEFTEKIGKILPKSIIMMVQEQNDKYKKNPKLFKKKSGAGSMCKNKRKVQRNSSIKFSPRPEKIEATQQTSFFERPSKTMYKRTVEEKSQKLEKDKQQMKSHLKRQINISKPKAAKSKPVEKRKLPLFEFKGDHTDQHLSTRVPQSQITKNKDQTQLLPLKFTNQSTEVLRNDSDKTPEMHKTLNSAPKSKTSYNSRLFFIKGKNKVKDQIHHLSILSEKDKKRHAVTLSKTRNNDHRERVREIKPIITSKQTNCPVTSRIQIYKRMKEKQKHNAEFLSTIWMENMTRYGRKLNVLMGNRVQDFV